MASSEVLSQTLSSITTIKLSQLQKQKCEYESRKRSLLEDIASETNTRKRAKALLDGTKHLPHMTTNPLTSLDNLARFVQQAEHDPSVSEHFLQDCEAGLRNDLEVQSSKYEFASLYGKLVNEWTSAGDQTEGFEPVGREEMHEQRATWEEYVFKPKHTDGAAVRAYLERVFVSGSKDVKRAYEALVSSVRDFQKNVMGWPWVQHFDEGSVTACIEAMLRSDLLTDEKRATLRDVLGNSVVLSEIADVLNMRMATRASWCWGEAQVVEQRRNLNGRYRFYPDEDLLHAILIHYIGRQFGVHLRDALVAFVNTEGVWKPDAKPIGKEDARRRRYFLARDVSNSWFTVERKRETHFMDEVFLDQLPTAMDEVRGSYGSDESEAGDTRKGHVQVTQELLHMIGTEITLSRKLDRDMVVVRSDFKWFGPSIPHSSIFAVLEFFGVDAEWLDFFRRVLEVPLRFKQDPVDAEPQTRRRGTPLSTPLADYMGEALLFVLDFVVNQTASTRLYRLHDDMWLWGEPEKCAAGWEAMEEFASVVGLDFNMDKTGCAVMANQGSEVGSAASALEKLPKGIVTWGLLRLDPESGRFVINQQEVDKHIAELELQLNACRTVFDWIHAWNVYGVRFFANNFGKPAHCYGRAHVDSMLSTFQHIQAALFGPESGGAGEYLKEMISSRFGVRDLPDGYLYFPVSVGGLGLQNPFVKLYLIRDQTVEEPEEIVDKFLEDEEAEYRRAKEWFEENGAAARPQAEWDDLKGEEFMSYDEFVRYRERTSALLLNAYNRLTTEPVEKYVELRGEVKAALEDQEEWDVLSVYDQWVGQLFSKDMVARFGGLNVVDKGLLPTGLMGMLRESRFKWHG